MGVKVYFFRYRYNGLYHVRHAVRVSFVTRISVFTRVKSQTISARPSNNPYARPQTTGLTQRGSPPSESSPPLPRRRSTHRPSSQASPGKLHGAAARSLSFGSDGATTKEASFSRLSSVFFLALFFSITILFYFLFFIYFFISWGGFFYYSGKDLNGASENAVTEYLYMKLNIGLRLSLIVEGHFGRC